MIIWRGVQLPGCHKFPSWCYIYYHLPFPLPLCLFLSPKEEAVALTSVGTKGTFLCGRERESILSFHQPLLIIKPQLLLLTLHATASPQNLSYCLETCKLFLSFSIKSSKKGKKEHIWEKSIGLGLWIHYTVTLFVSLMWARPKVLLHLLDFL